MGTRSSWLFFKSRNTHFGQMSSFESTRPSQKMQVLFMEYQESSRRGSIVYCPRGSVKETGTFYFPWFTLAIPRCARSTRAFIGRALREHRESADFSPFLFLLSSDLPLEGVARWSLTARIEGPSLYRGSSASKKDCLATPFFLPLLLLSRIKGSGQCCP